MKTTLNQGLNKYLGCDGFGSLLDICSSEWILSTEYLRWKSKSLDASEWEDALSTILRSPLLLDSEDRDDVESTRLRGASMHVYQTIKLFT